LAEEKGAAAQDMQKLKRRADTCSPQENERGGKRHPTESLGGEGSKLLNKRAAWGGEGGGGKGGRKKEIRPLFVPHKNERGSGGNLVGKTKRAANAAKAHKKRVLAPRR